MGAAVTLLEVVGGAEKRALCFHLFLCLAVFRGGDFSLFLSVKGEEGRGFSWRGAVERSVRVQAGGHASASPTVSQMAAVSFFLLFPHC